MAKRGLIYLLQEGDGFIVVKEPQKYDLPSGVPSSQGQQYDITVFHQLHCLRYIRTFTYSILDLAQKGVSNEGERYFVDHPDDHIFHCFDYIRQGLMCNADMTVESPKEEDDGSHFAVNGWGIAHQCKSWVSDRLLLEVPIKLYGKYESANYSIYPRTPLWSTWRRIAFISLGN